MELSSKENKINIFLNLFIFVLGSIYFNCIAYAKQETRDSVKVVPTISITPKTTMIDVNNKFSYDEDIVRKEDPAKLNLFGDSLGFCPIIKFDVGYYIAGIFYANKPIVCTDMTKGYQALSFKKDLWNNLQRNKSQKIEDLYESGWALYFGDFQLSVINRLWDDPIIRCLADHFITFPIFDIVNREGIKGFKNMYFGTFNTQPDAYLLIMIRGDYVNKLLFDNCVDCVTERIKLKSPSLYYPMVQPLIKNTPKDN